MHWEEGSLGVQVRVCQLPQKVARPCTRACHFFGRGVGGGGESDDGGDEGDRQGGHHPPADVEEAECGDHQPLLQLHPWPALASLSSANRTPAPAAKCAASARILPQALVLVLQI